MKIKLSRTIASHHNSLNTKRPRNDVGNSGSGLRQAQKCDGVKPVDE